MMRSLVLQDHPVPSTVFCPVQCLVRFLQKMVVVLIKHGTQTPGAPNDAMYGSSTIMLLPGFELASGMPDVAKYV